MLEIPEYWIVDPRENQITVLDWNGGLYEETVFDNEAKIVSSTFPELELTANEVLAIE